MSAEPSSPSISKAATPPPTLIERLKTIVSKADVKTADKAAVKSEFKEAENILRQWLGQRETFFNNSSEDNLFFYLVEITKPEFQSLLAICLKNMLEKIDDWSSLNPEEPFYNQPGFALPIYRRNPQGQSPIFYAIDLGNVAAVKAIVKAGKSNIDLSLEQLSTGPRDTPLIYAARHNKIDVIEALLDMRANPYVINVLGETALVVALNNNHADAAKLLLAYHYKKNPQAIPPELLTTFKKKNLIAEELARLEDISSLRTHSKEKIEQSAELRHRLSEANLLFIDLLTAHRELGKLKQLQSLAKNTSLFSAISAWEVTLPTRTKDQKQATPPHERHSPLASPSLLPSSPSSSTSRFWSSSPQSPGSPTTPSKEPECLSLKTAAPYRG